MTTLDSKPVAWRYEYSEWGTHWHGCVSIGEPEVSAHIRNITPLYAHPPADSIEKAIGELEKTGWKFKLSGPHKSLETGLTKFRCELLSPILPLGRKPHSADGPTILSAIRAAMEGIEK